MAGLVTVLLMIIFFFCNFRSLFFCPKKESFPLVLVSICTLLGVYVIATNEMLLPRHVINGIYNYWRERKKIEAATKVNIHRDQVAENKNEEKSLSESKAQLEAAPENRLCLQSMLPNCKVTL